ncbi:flagellar protein FlaG [Clostridium taeniosporum]|uniref:Flagellar biosynthesis protein FlaG n=1 Tax=Clostridium taeniosporum TaxID=394958 RepID=A0A1D7XHT4_9CLOT|nr:flagellar protein FlaG [Clostridium taeniosporum]AOR22903.1 flagellar biosynthesis protein FlaG [Clostridium taeniosporum]
MNINPVGQVVINNDFEGIIPDFKNTNNEEQIKQIEKSHLSDKNYSKEELDKSLKKLNKFLEDDKVHAEYSVHKDLKSVMIKIVDDSTKKVILEIPPKKILDMVASMCKQVGLLDKRA